MASCGSVVAPALVLADDDMSVGVRRGAVERFVHEGNIRRGGVGGKSGREDPRCLRYDDACLESSCNRHARLLSRILNNEVELWTPFGMRVSVSPDFYF